ncbi:ABC transporter substrate-binding protein [Undibacterium sp. RuRC25W]|uniref:ABC transporter substrate-binding protein n=1 Tax=Undibacterium sp. RuRC25W TaxID=3413047 RepID=UPI003BF389BF
MKWMLMILRKQSAPIRLLKSIVFFAFLGFAPSSFAVDGVTILLSEEGGAYSEFAISLGNILTQSTNNRPAVKIIAINKFTSDDLPHTSNSQIIIAVGTSAMLAMAQKLPAIPVLNVLIPQNSFIKAIKQSNRLQDSRRFSAVYVDQSWARQFGLIQVTMSSHPRVGVLLGRDETESIPALQSAAKEADISLNIETVSDDAELLTALRKLLMSSDAMMAVPDPKIYNRNNISSILLTSYRQQIPLFGFSASYVKAGALAAVYSLPSQISQQVAEIINNLPSNGNLPAPQHPRYFSVNTNQQVARSLGINIASDSELQNKLKHLTERAQ